MKKHFIEISLKDDPMNYTIVGYEGLKKSELHEYLEDFVKEKELTFGKGSTIIDFQGNDKGYYEFYSKTI